MLKNALRLPSLLVTPLVFLIVFPAISWSGEVDIIDPAPVVESPWSFEISPYAWATWIDGSLAVGNVEATGSYDFDEALKDLNGGFMIGIGAKYKRLGYYLDFMYASLSPERNFSGPIFDSISIDLEQYKVDQYLTYDVIATDRLTVSLGGGARYQNTDQTLTAAPGLARRGVSASAESEIWDAVGAGQVIYDLTDRLFLKFFGDVGGTDSESTWQIYAGGGYQMRDRLILTLAYRKLVYEFQKGPVSTDLELKGPQLGLTFTF